MRSSNLSDISVEPSAIQRLTPEEKDRLTDILDRYLSSLESGVPLRREALLEAHPELAGPLQTYLDSLDELHNVAAGFGGLSAGSEPEAASLGSDQQRLGDFRLLREIGRGGMGVVYEAQQISLGRRVALKVLPFAAVLDSKQIARFQHEAKAAAQLLHPNIVSVFAVGVERGVHYYAMQFIDGQPLDRAIKQLREAAGFDPCPSSGGAAGKSAAAEGLVRREKTTVTYHGARHASSSNHHRDGSAAAASAAIPVGVPVSAETAPGCPSTCHSFLTAKPMSSREYFRTVVRLGIQAAEALHAAHEHGVVHRDIKPSNLLLDGDGKLWVTDFGLARCHSDAPLTNTGDVLGTMRYMSPEQALGQPALVDQRTDVYSLGVTLYELITLEPAFGGDGGPALLRRIDQQEPKRPRLCQPKIPADLETVVLKAMAKRREERYTTAQEFADDLQRVLDGKPTAAKPPTIPQRLGKWASRHRRFVAAAAAVGLFAVVGMALSTMLIARANLKTEQNYERAEKHFREAQDAVDRFGVRLAERLAEVPGADQVRKELLQETLRYYTGFVEQAKDDPALRADLALTYSKIGTLTGEIGSTEQAVEAHENAIRLFEQLVAGNPRERSCRRRLAVAQNNLALVLSRSGRIDAARKAYSSAIRLQEQLARETDDAEELGELALSHNNLGLLQVGTGEPANAEASFREAIRLQEDLLKMDPDNPERLRNRAASFNNLSAIYADDQPTRAAELYERALADQTKGAAARPNDLKYRNDVALTYNNLGKVQSRTGQLEKAAASYAQAIELQRELVRAAPAQMGYRCDLGISYNNLGLTQSKLRQSPDAERSFRQALDLQETLLRQNPHDVELRSSLGGIHNNLGMVLEELGRTADAAENFQKAVEYQKIAYLHAPKVSRYRFFLSKHYFNYGRALRRLGRPDEAARAALARRELWPDDPQHLLAVAEELASATKLLADDTTRSMTQQQCAELAVETLRHAVAAGWKPPASLGWADTFAAIKDTPGFAEFVKH